MKVLVIGNCQARPLSALLERVPSIDVTNTIVIHLAKDMPASEIEGSIEEVDLVLSQQTFGTAWHELLRSDELSNRYPQKTVVWPNIFFAGQQPFLRYVTHARNGRVLSPLTEYHDLWMLREWFQSRLGRDFADDITDPDYTASVAEKSLATLKRREEKCDVAVADLIEEHQFTDRLFFTFNHPSLWLLARLCDRILERIDMPRTFSLEGMREPLSRIQPPFFLPRTDTGSTYQGVEVELGDAAKVVLGRVRPFSGDELREATFACYDHQQEILEDVGELRLTP